MDATMENKMGLPPVYDHPTPPPSYFGNNPPMPPGYVPPTAPPVPPRTAVITQGQTPQHAPSRKLGPGPTGITCGTCNKSVITRVDYVSSSRTHIVSAALCVIAGCCCGCFIPYCMKSCKTANHYCPSCQAFIGTYVPS